LFYKSDNRLENLEWMTCSENHKHAFKVGLKNNKGENHPMFGKHHTEKAKRKQSEKMRGENSSNSILTEKDAIEILGDLNERKLTQKEIAEKFGVKQSTISNIKNKRRWKHI